MVPEQADQRQLGPVAPGPSALGRAAAACRVAQADGRRQTLRAQHGPRHVGIGEVGDRPRVAGVPDAAHDGAHDRQLEREPQGETRPDDPPRGASSRPASAQGLRSDAHCTTRSGVDAGEQLGDVVLTGRVDDRGGDAGSRWRSRRSPAIACDRRRAAAGEHDATTSGLSASAAVRRSPRSPAPMISTVLDGLSLGQVSSIACRVARNRWCRLRGRPRPARRRARNPSSTQPCIEASIGVSSARNDRRSSGSSWRSTSPRRSRRSRMPVTVEGR